MENDQWRFRGMEKLNFKCYFDTNYTYVEEFDTEDGHHWMGRVKPEDWTPDILQRAIDAGIVDP